MKSSRDTCAAERIDTCNQQAYANSSSCPKHLGILTPMKKLLLVLLIGFASVLNADITKNTKLTPLPSTPSYTAPSIPRVPPRAFLAKGIVTIEKSGSLPVGMAFRGIQTQGKAEAIDVKVATGTNASVTVYFRVAHNSTEDSEIFTKILSLLQKAEKEKIPVAFWGHTARDRLFFTKIEVGAETVDLFAP